MKTLTEIIAQLNNLGYDMYEVSYGWQSNVATPSRPSLSFHVGHNGFHREAIFGDLETNEPWRGFPTTTYDVSCSLCDWWMEFGELVTKHAPANLNH